MAARPRAGSPAHPDGRGAGPDRRDRPGAKLFVVCHAGGRSLRVAQYLARNGYEPVNVNGGMLAWAGAGRPVVTDDGGVGTVVSEPSLGWSDDPGVFPVRDAVERARPAASLVSALPRRPAGAVGAAPAIGVECAPTAPADAPERQTPAAAAAGIPLDRGAAGPPRRPGVRGGATGPDAALCGDSPLGSGGAVRIADASSGPPRRGPSVAAVRATLIATMAVLGVAALVHVVRYALLIINRTVLLNPVVAGAATWLGVAVSVVAMFMVVASARAADELADRAAGGGVRHAGVEEPDRCGRCGRVAWCRW